MNTNTPKTDTSASKKSDGSNVSFGADKSLQEKIMKQIKELGDSLERAGQKVEKSGWETIGQAIYKLGNSLEHFNEKSAGDKSGIKTKSAKPYTDKEFDDKSKKPEKNDSQAY